MAPHRRFALGALALALAALPGAAAAQNQLLDFSSYNGSPNYTDIAQTYGDIAGVLDVSNRTRNGFGNAGLTACSQAGSNVEYWYQNYSGLVDIAFACSDGRVGEFFFQPLAGFQVTLHSFNFGSYSAPLTGPNAGVGPARNFTLRIYDGAWNLLLNQSLTVSSAIAVAPNVTSTTGLYLQWGSDWDVGIDNISVTAAQISAVPEPSTYALMATGLVTLAGIAALRRRRA